MQLRNNQTKQIFIANTPKCSSVNGCKSTLFCHIHCSWRRGVATQRHLTEGAAGKLRFIKASNFCCHIVLRHVLPRPVRGDSPCGGCWGCSPQRCELDAASSRTLGSPTTTGSSVVSTKKCLSSTACRGCCAFGRKMLDETLLL